MTRELIIDVHPISKDQVRVRVLDSMRNRVIIDSDYWDGGPPVGEAVAGFVRVWLNEASYEVMRT